MPSRSLQIPLIPHDWKREVIAILTKGRSVDVIWTLRAQQEWQEIDSDFMFKESGHQLLIRQLNLPDLRGENVIGMYDGLDGTMCDTWAFLCPHPNGGIKQVYAKIGLHNKKVRVCLFSLHIDNTGKLEKLNNKVTPKRK